MNSRGRWLMASASICATIILTSIIIKKKPKGRRRWWVKPWLQRRLCDKGMIHMLNHELKMEDPEAYRNFIRMCSSEFDDLLNMIEADIQKEDTTFRESIPANVRLAVTLRYLASGESIRSLMYSCRIHESTISLFIPEVCKAIYEKLRPLYLQTPQSVNEWEKIANEFEAMWQFPLCLGAIDGKHIRFQAPRSAGSYFYNYKNTHSIVLLAVAAANYSFLYVNAGVNGRISDGGVFRASTLKRAIDDGVLNFPPDKCLPTQNTCIPYCFVADEAFPLSHRIMKPFSSRNLTNDKRIFNYRLSRARRVVENAFGIMSNKFRILLQNINLSPEKVELITLTCCALHNYLISKNVHYTDTVEVQNPLCDLQQIQGANRATREALNNRQLFMDYFLNAGRVPWQEQCLQ